jgi:hypothetical protein
MIPQSKVAFYCIIKHKGNTEEENNGYVVLKSNILSAGKKNSREGGKRYSASPHPFMQEGF